MADMDRAARSAVRRAIVFGFVFSTGLSIISVIFLVDLLGSEDKSLASKLAQEFLGVKITRNDVFYLFFIASVGIILTLALIFFGRRMVSKNDEITKN